MLYATLHAVATPLRGGLTQALGRKIKECHVRKVIALLCLSTVLIAFNVQAGKKSDNGVYRPTMATLPKSYLKKFPLYKATTDEII